MTQRRHWADYFDKQNVRYAFFSAANATALQEARKEALEREEEAAKQASDTSHGDEDEEADEHDEEVEHSGDSSYEDEDSSDDESDNELYFSAEEDTEDGQDPRTRVLSVLELESLFIHAAPDLSGEL